MTDIKMTILDAYNSSNKNEENLLNNNAISLIKDKETKLESYTQVQQVSLSPFEHIVPVKQQHR